MGHIDLGPYVHFEEGDAVVAVADAHIVDVNLVCPHRLDAAIRVGAAAGAVTRKAAPLASMVPSPRRVTLTRLETGRRAPPVWRSVPATARGCVAQGHPNVDMCGGRHHNGTSLDTDHRIVDCPRAGQVTMSTRE